MTTDDYISQLRKEIDGIDEQILRLINQRLEIALEVGKVKAQKGSQVVDASREAMILERLEGLNTGPLSKNMLQQIFTQIIASSRDVQKSHRVAYLGPEATFTHIAAMGYFGHTVSYMPQPGIPDVFREVEKGFCHYGVVPIENSLEGSVTYTLDLLFETDLKICAEKYLPITHDLVAASGSLKDIQVIYSHPQAFGQCRRWLQKYLPDVRLEECSSTSYAAQKAAQTPASAAISSSEAAKLYRLQVLASRIEDVARNTTRFVVIGRDQPHRTGADKTSVMFVTSHIPGALYRTLQPIAEAGINLVKLESRPTKHENWSYFFFADMEGHIEDAIIQDAVAEIKKRCLFMKWLGSYPKETQG